jgi:hypothetical protein
MGSLELLCFANGMSNDHGHLHKEGKILIENPRIGMQPFKVDIALFNP